MIWRFRVVKIYPILNQRNSRSLSFAYFTMNLLSSTFYVHEILVYDGKTIGFFFCYQVLDLFYTEFCDVFRVQIKFSLMKSYRTGGTHWAACSNYFLFMVLSRTQDRLTTSSKATRGMTWKSGLNKWARANSTWEWTIFVLYGIELFCCAVYRYNSSQQQERFEVCEPTLWRT